MMGCIIILQFLTSASLNIAVDKIYWKINIEVMQRQRLNIRNSQCKSSSLGDKTAIYMAYKMVFGSRFRPFIRIVFCLLFGSRH